MDTSGNGSDLSAFFSPRSIAVVGVSEREGNLAANILENLRAWGYAGEVYPVGQSEGTVHGYRVLASVEALPPDVEVACVLTPAPTVPGIVAQLGQRGIRAVCVETSGFDELDDAGRSLGARLLEATRAHRMRLMGPNCIGTSCPGSRTCVSFALLRPLPPGPVAIVSQSGGVAFSYLRDIEEQHLGLSKSASIGNKLDLDEVDLVRFLDTDPSTRVICLYLEDIRRGRALMEAAAACSKPVVLHKANRSPLTEQIAASHTASLLTDQSVVEAAARQAGILTADGSAAALLAAKSMLLPPLRGRRLAVVSRSGGHAVIAADACAARGFELPELPTDLLDQLREKLRAGVIRLGNPLDLGDLWDMEVYGQILERIAGLDRIDGMVLVFVSISPVDPAAPARLVERAAQISRQTDKPIALALVSWQDIVQHVSAAVDWPLFATVEHAVEALAVQRDFHLRRERASAPDAREVRTSAATTAPLSLERCLALLGERRLPVVETRVVQNPAEAAAAAEEIGFPAVVKLASPDLVHKSDAGGVHLDLQSADEVARASEQMLESAADKRIEGLVVQAQAKEGLEMIVGLRQDSAFGPVVVAGLGGTLVELFQDVALRVAPVTVEQALDLLAELRGHPLLTGARGADPVDLGALAVLIERLSHLAVQHPEVIELELNPVIVYPGTEGCVIVDVRGRIRRGEAP
jgi:acetyltransferase